MRIISEIALRPAVRNVGSLASIVNLTLHARHTVPSGVSLVWYVFGDIFNEQKRENIISISIDLTQFNEAAKTKIVELVQTVCPKTTPLVVVSS